jgi:hypothetical protein
MLNFTILKDYFAKRERSNISVDPIETLRRGTRNSAKKKASFHACCVPVSPST